VLRQHSDVVELGLDAGGPAAAVLGQLLGCPPLGSLGQPRLSDLGERQIAGVAEERQVPDVLGLFAGRIGQGGTPLLHSNIQLTFAGLARRCGITPRSASCRPRIHDLRHAFAVTSLLSWYVAGEDVAAMLPRLATYLGHADPKHTFWYLSAAPELMALAGQRLDAHLERQP